MISGVIISHSATIYKMRRPGVSFIKLCVGSLLSVCTPKSQVLRALKNIQTYKTLRTHTSKQSLLHKSQSAYKCAQLNQLHVLPCTRQDTRPPICRQTSACLPVADPSPVRPPTCRRTSACLPVIEPLLTLFEVN